MPPSSLPDSPSASSPPFLFDHREPHPASSNEDPRRRHPPSNHPPDDPDGLDEKDIRAALRERRRLIEEEVNAFRRRKEAELREFEILLRKKKRKREGLCSEIVDCSQGDGLESSGGVGGTALSPGATSTTIHADNGAGKATGVQKRSGGEIPSSLDSSVQEGGLNLQLGDGERCAPPPTSIKRSEPGETSGAGRRDWGAAEDNDQSPPFEKALQAAGLFTPNYLPLLESRFRTSPPTTEAPRMLEANPAPEQPPPARYSTPPNSGRSDGQSSPALPLASSLKSSSSSSFDTSTHSRKIKSPKKVTFHFDDENLVPSRSSPPPTKVAWSFGPLEDDDFEGDDSDEEAGREEYVENVDSASMDEIVEDDSDEESSTVEQVEDVAAPSRVVAGKRIAADRYQGDALVTPTSVGPENRCSGPNPAASYNPSTLQASTTAEGITSPHPISPSPFADMRSPSNDDDDVLFDLDETVPEELDRSPPHRDISPLMSAQQASPELSPTSPPTLPSAAAIPLPPSVPSSTLTFSKSPPARVAARRSSLSSSFTHSPLRSHDRPVPNPTPVAASLPSASNFGSLPLGSVDNSRFRRRSITKYIPSPPPEVDESTESSPRDKSLEPALGSPYASSLPMAISPRPPFVSPPNSKSPLSSATKKDIPDEQPVSARPSPTTENHVKPVLSSVNTDDRTETSSELLAASESSSPPSSRHSEVDSYRRSAPFPSASFGGLMSPYRTQFAAEIAEQASKEPGYSESVVGGVDGRSGLDPTPGMNSFSMTHGGSVTGSVPMSFSQRMAIEEAMDARRSGN